MLVTMQSVLNGVVLSGGSGLGPHSVHRKYRKHAALNKGTVDWNATINCV